MGYTGQQKRDYQNAWLTKRRTAWIEDQGGQCSICGSSEGLEVDHIDPSTKLVNPKAIWNRSKAFREAELAKCQVLCTDCHKAKTLVDRGHLAHGTVSMYKNQGCRCRACTDANTASVRRYRQSKK